MSLRRTLVAYTGRYGRAAKTPSNQSWASTFRIVPTLLNWCTSVDCHHFPADVFEHGFKNVIFLEDLLEMRRKILSGQQ